LRRDQFTNGSSTAIFGIIRTNESSRGFKVTIPDNSYTSISGLVWAGMERNIAILLGSIPQCRPLVVPVSNYTKTTWSRITGSTYANFKGSSKGQAYGTHETNGSKRSEAYSNHSRAASKQAATSTVPSNSSREEILLPDYQAQHMV
jgi:hypothetical protein